MPCRLLLAFCLGIAATCARAGGPFDFDATPGKLPKDVVPIAYRLHLVPDVAALRTEGRVDATIAVLRPVSRIVLNARDLEIDWAVLSGPGRPQSLSPRLDAERQTLSFDVPGVLAPGRYQLAIAFRGMVQRSPLGLYVDRYTGADGREKTLLGTLLEPAEARRVLPLWDEPSFRAVFRLSVDLPAGVHAVSNMPAVSTAQLAGGGTRTDFGATPRMPPYLLALVAGELERRSVRAGGIETSVVTTAGKLASATVALGEAPRLLRYLQTYFGIRYPLSKLDHIATPGGFAGAMENWGAIVYNEAILLFDPATQAASAKDVVTGIMAHEMAHQWFGNLVTMAWWDDLWLNEGFASWMGTKAADALHPDRHEWLAAVGSRERAMALDARGSTHPIQQPVDDESQLWYAFDEITYSKGMGFLRMLEAYLGEAPFRDGVRRYLLAHRNSNATSADLWAALGAATGKPVAALASDWTLRPGFPRIDVDARCDAAGRRHVTLRQMRFRTDAPVSATAAANVGGAPVAGIETAAARAADAGPADATAVDAKPPGPPDGATVWHVPIALTQAAGPPVHTLLQTPEAEVEQAGCAAPLMADPEGVGFFRVHYAPALFATVRERFADWPDGGRVKLVSDTAAFARAGVAPWADYTSLVARLGDEPRFAVWSGVLDQLRAVDRLLDATPAQADWRRWGISVLRPRFDALGWDERAGDTDDTRRLRNELAETLSDLGDTGVVRAARDRFHRFLADPSSLRAFEAERVVAIAGTWADADDHRALLRLAESTAGTTERKRYFSALLSARDPALAAASMPLALRTDLPPYLVDTVLGRIAQAGHADAAWAFAVAHVDALLATHAEPHQQNAAFSDVAAESSRAALADEMLAFSRQRLSPATLPQAERDAAVLRERAAVRSRLLAQPMPGR